MWLKGSKPVENAHTLTCGQYPHVTKNGNLCQTCGGFMSHNIYYVCESTALIQHGTEKIDNEKG